MLLPLPLLLLLPLHSSFHPKIHFFKSSLVKSLIFYNENWILLPKNILKVLKTFQFR